MFGVVKHYFSSYAHQVSFYLIKNLVKTVQYKNNYYNLNIRFLFEYILNVIYSCDAKLNFQHHYTSLQYHMLLQKTV